MRWNEQELADYMRRQGADKPSLLQAEADRQDRQGLADDKTESWIQQEGVRQARLLMMANGYDPRLLFSIPNGAHIKNAAVQGGRLVGEGLVSGVPDLQLAVCKLATPCAWIEVKRPSGRLSKEQKEMRALLEGEGGEYYVCYSAEQIVHAVIGYLGINTPAGDRDGPADA